MSRQLDSIGYAGLVFNAVRHVLVVDADPDAVSYANTSLPGMELEAVATSVAALERVVGSTFDAVLLDPALSEGDDDALALLHRMRTVAPDTVVVIWSEQPTVGFAVRAMRAGALDVLKKTAAAAVFFRTSSAPARIARTAKPTVG